MEPRTNERRNERNTMLDRIPTIDTRCEAPETDTIYEGAHLSAEYDADYDCTEISGQTYQCKDALKGLDGARWTGSAWIVDGNKVAHVRNADAHWAGGRTTLVRRIASALRTPMRDECAWCGDIHDCTVGDVTEAATCAAIDLTTEAQAEATARRIAVSLRSVVVAAAKGAAYAVRSARAKRAWETRRRNAARQAEILSATCEPLVAADVTAECCEGTAHDTEDRVVTDYPQRPFAAPAALLCDTGRLPTRKPHADYRWSTASEMEAVDTWYRTAACEFPDFRQTADGTYRYGEKCIGPREGRAARRRARDAAWHREHRRLARERKAA